MIFRLFFEFFKIGLFAVGGGLATIPFLNQLSVSTGWFPQSLITDMIAVSESTPGPIGINMATYVGYNIGGIPGAVMATLGEIMPAIILCLIVSRGLAKFRDSTIVKDIFYGLRPAVTGLIAAAGIEVVKTNLIRIEAFIADHSIGTLFDIKKIVFFVIVFILIRKFKKHPVVYIAGSAAVGILLNF